MFYLFLCKLKLTCGICGNVTVVAQFSSHKEHLFLQRGQILPVQHQMKTCGKCDFSKHLAKMLTWLNKCCMLYIKETSEMQNNDNDDMKTDRLKCLAGYDRK